MKNWKLRFTFDGYRFWDVVKAESADQAIAYHAWIVPDSSGHVAEETDDLESYVVPAGWQQPERPEPMSSEEMEIWDQYLDYCAECECEYKEIDITFDEWRERYAS